MKKVTIAVIATVLFGKMIPLLAVALVIVGIVIIFAEAIKEGKKL